MHFSEIDTSHWLARRPGCSSVECLATEKPLRFWAEPLHIYGSHFEEIVTYEAFETNSRHAKRSGLSRWDSIIVTELVCYPYVAP
jgi:hypothetical protein